MAPDGSGFSVKNSTGATERLRVDEATGNVSRKYHEMAPMLLNEMQRQQHTIEAQREAIAALGERVALLEVERRAAGQ